MTIEFAVIDFETTGFSPSKNRVIEIGVVRTDSSGRVLGEYQTLIQPHQDVGRTDIHGISATDLVEAPVFGDVLQDLAQILNGAILVAHNAKFDFSFLEHELDRAQAAFLDIDGLCTLELVYQVLPSGSRKLSNCCEHFDIPLGNLHSALDDARMTAQLLSKLLESTDIPGLPEPFEIQPPDGPGKGPLHRSPISINNPKIVRAITKHTSQMPARPAKGQISTATVSQYLNLLDAVLQDEFLNKEELEALEELAILLNLDSNEMALLNSAYVHNLCRTAMSDQIVTEEERRHIRAIAELLHVTDWEQILDGPQKPSEPMNVGEGSNLAGLRVCFTGTMNQSREECHDQATRHGLLVQDNVTKKLDILVVADQNSESSKARKAREYSVRIINEAAFFELLSP
jgi:DNA polymerase-3 subunit epsilon